MCRSINGMLVKAEPSTITPRKPSDRKKDESRNVAHWIFRISDAGPYKGSGGNSGLVRDGGAATPRGASADSDCGEEAALEGPAMVGDSDPLRPELLPRLPLPSVEREAEADCSCTLNSLSLYASSGGTPGNRFPSAVRRMGSWGVMKMASTAALLADSSLDAS